MASAPENPLALFHKILELHSDEFALGQAIKTLSDAILGDGRYAKFAAIVNAATALDRSHSLADARALLVEVHKYCTNVNTEIPAAVQAIMALMGDCDSERFVSWRLLFCYQHDRDLSFESRNKLLIQSLGWMQQSIGACSLTASWLGSNGVTDLVNLLGYSFIAEIKRTNLDTSSFETIVDGRPDGRDAVIPHGHDRYTDHPWNFDDGPSRLPALLLGRIAETAYTSGAESPLLHLGAMVARIRHRTGSNFEVLCNHVLDNPGDTQAGWQLVEAMRYQKDADYREEIEALVVSLAFAGDRQALLEAASYAVRRGYHSCDKDLLTFALGALAVASGIREVTPVEPNENSVDVSLSQAGEYLVKGLMAQAPASERERIKGSLESFMKSEETIGAERRQDEEDEARRAAQETSAAGEEPDDDVSDDADATPSPIAKFGHLLDDGATPKPKSGLSSIQLRSAQIRANRPEAIRVVHEIGNADVAAKEIKHALEKITRLMQPMKLAEMPNNIGAWCQGLVAEFPHAEVAIEAIHGDLQTRAMNGRKGLRFKPTLLVGSPGCGKSRLARRLAETLKIGFKLVPCGGVADSHFGGVSRGWTSSHPSVPIDLIRSTNTPNPVIILDEIEKSASGRQNGNLLDIVLAMLEPETSKMWTDPFIQGHCDLSAVNWLMTANSLSGLPSPLLDRLRIIHVDSPTLTHLPALASTIIRELGTASGHENWHQPLDQVELNAVGRAWSRQPSLRYLKRLIEGCLRAREMSSGRH